MKCAACGYKHDPDAKGEWEKNDGHGGSYTVGRQPFVWGGRFGENLELYACPKCGTVRAE